MSETGPAAESASSAESLRPRVSKWTGMWVSATLVVLLALREIDAMIGRLLDANRGQTYSPTGLTGPTTLNPFGLKSEFVPGWRFLADQCDQLDVRLPAWLLTYALVDGLFIVLYCVALLRLVGTSALRNRVWVLAGLDAGEGLLVAAHGTAIGGSFITWILIVTSALKWLSAIWVVCGLVRRRRRWLRRRVGRSTASVLRGLYTHRYALLIVAPLALMSLGHGHDILEQVPDIERRWIEDDILHGVAAMLLTVVLAAATLLIGRLRTDDLWRRREQATVSDRPKLRLWIVSALVIGVVAIVVELLGGTIRWGSVALFGGVPLAVVFLSWLVRVFGLQGSPPAIRPTVDMHFRTAWVVGDVLPALLIVALGASGVRSLLSVVLLGDRILVPLLVMLAGTTLAVGVWPAYSSLLDWLAATPLPAASIAEPVDGGLTADQPPASPHSQVKRAIQRVERTTGRSLLEWLRPGAGDGKASLVPVIVLIAGLVGYLAVGMWPNVIAQLGVVAAFQITLGCLAVAVAAAVSVNRRNGVPYIFWRLRLTVAPVAILILATASGSALFGAPVVHPIVRSDSAEVERPDAQKMFNAWSASTEGCVADVGEHKVRPMILLAAEGGGIRAAYWTAAVVDRIDAAGGEGQCGRAFISTGASGGSVGLTIASLAERGQATDRVRAISGPSALSQAVVGLVARDQLFAGAGIGLPLGSNDAGWVDRAALIERSWVSSIGDLGDDFFYKLPDMRTGADGSPVGALVLNSTASNGCRAVLSQLELQADWPASTCRGSNVALPGSVDVYQCTGQLTAATAALLSARFPYVTPAGEARCDDLTLKFVDGGYGENTGIVTQVDLISQWLPYVREHNASAGGDEAVIVPILVYLDNGTGSDIVPSPGRPPAEILLPPLTKGAATATLASPESNLQRATALIAVDQLGLDQATADALATWRGNATAVVYSPSVPAVAAPLGWVLSTRAMDEMDTAVVTNTAALPGHMSLAEVVSIIEEAVPD